MSGYGGLDFVGHDVQRRTKKRVIVIAVSAIALVAIIIGVVVGVTRNNDSKSHANLNTSPSASIKSICGRTEYPDKCYATLLEATKGKNLDPVKLYQLSLQLAMTEVHTASIHLEELKASRRLDAKYVSALDTCNKLLGLAYNRLNQSASSTDLTKASVVEDLRTWLSASLTYHETCLDGFQNSTGKLHAQIGDNLTNSTELSSNSLAILTQISDFLGSFKRRKLLNVESKGFPSWVSIKDRKLLQEADPRASATIVVAADGSGKYKTIGEALDGVPERSESRTVIYVKKGVYEENVMVGTSLWNVMMVGDGADATIVTGSLNFVDGTPTFDTATFAVFGQGFIAQDMCFRNTAGAEKHQAVALMSASDKSIFYRCTFDAFQDTLYAHSLRQFYRACDVLGTIDFIFGNAAVVFQNCNILPRKPMSNQFDTITAQGKTDKNQNTGISLHQCNVTGFDDLDGVKVYYGRPWKKYSTTVFMRSFISGVIDPSGWTPWTGNKGPGTIFYGEFENTGPGASTDGRVEWKGVYSDMTTEQASGFTVGSFLGGESWIPDSGAPFDAGL